MATKITEGRHAAARQQARKITEGEPPPRTDTAAPPPRVKITLDGALGLLTARDAARSAARRSYELERARRTRAEMAHATDA
jgi:hypothetical protein